MKSSPTKPISASARRTTSVYYFHVERLPLLLQCLDSLRRLSGRLLGYGVIPEFGVEDAIMDARDLLEDLGYHESVMSPSSSILLESEKLREFIQTLPPSTAEVRGEPITAQQKVILGDLSLYLQKAHQIVAPHSDGRFILKSIQVFFSHLLESVIILSLDFLDADFDQRYELETLIEQLRKSFPKPQPVTDSRDSPLASPASPASTTSPVSTTPTAPLSAPPPATAPEMDYPFAAPPGLRSLPKDTGVKDTGEKDTGVETPSSLVADAIMKAATQGEGDWGLGTDGLVQVPEPGEGQDDLAQALGGGELGDEVWDEVWMSDDEAGSQGAAVQEDFSADIQSIHNDEIQGLFTSIAKQFCQPLPSLMCNLQTQDLTAEHLEGIFGIIINISNAAKEFNYEELLENLDRLRKPLEKSQCSPKRLTARQQVQILMEYDKLCVEFSDIFEPIESLEVGQRLKESIIIMEELRTIKGLGQRRITKLFAAGITNLQAFCAAQLTDFAAVSTIDRLLAEKILMAFRPYEILVAKFVGDDVLHSFLEEQRKDLRTEIGRLLRIHEIYAHEAKQPKFREQRHRIRELHHIREGTMSRIRCALAVLEEFELIESMRKMRYDKRLEILMEYIVNELKLPTIDLREVDDSEIPGLEPFSQSS